MYRGFVLAVAAPPWVLAWGPLLRVTPPLSHPVSCHIFSCSITKADKRPTKKSGPRKEQWWTSDSVMGGHGSLMHVGSKGRAVWSDPTDELMFFKLLKKLMLVLIERYQNTQCITVCCVWGCIATDQTGCPCWPLSSQNVPTVSTWAWRKWKKVAWSDESCFLLYHVAGMGAGQGCFSIKRGPTQYSECYAWLVQSPLVWNSSSIATFRPKQLSFSCPSCVDSKCTSAHLCTPGCAGLKVRCGLEY